MPQNAISHIICDTNILVNFSITQHSNSLSALLEINIIIRGSHFYITCRQSLVAEKHVLCEFPLATSQEGAKQLRKLAEHNGEQQPSLYMYEYINHFVYNILFLFST